MTSRKAVKACLNGLQRAAALSVPQRAYFKQPIRRLYHSSPALDTEMNAKPTAPSFMPSRHSIAASMNGPHAPEAAMKDSPTLTSEGTSTVEAGRNSAFLGEADSDDHFEADVEINPETHRHRLEDVSASGIHGQAGEGDEPIESERRAQEPLDASQSAFLGESDSDDAHEADRELNPEKYRHRIDDPGASGMHGESGHDDEPFEKERRPAV